MLDIRNLTMYYRTRRGIVKAVDDVSFQLRDGETLGLVGESGCGKSSTALAMMRLLPRNAEQYEGQVILDDQNLMELDENAFRRQVRWRKMSMVFQGAMNSLNPVLKVGFQVAEPLILHQRMKKHDALKKAEQLFYSVGLPPEFVERYPHELSGGMKQRVILSMALILNPNIVILDEPTSALDVSIQAQIMNLLKQLKKDRDISMLFITHDIALASDLCDKIAVMYAGQILEIGPSENILLNPQHPYTQKLIASVPLLRDDRKPEFIPGAPPDLVNTFTGCRFYPRCTHEKCDFQEKAPSLKEIESGHYIRCWINGDE